MQYILRRILSSEECPGTCCRKSPCFPDKNGKCPYLLENHDGRVTACSIFIERPPELTDEQYEIWIKRGRDWPVPCPVPSFNTPCNTRFGRGFSPSCDCFEWEVLDNGNA
jgi:hypothetical protein